MRHRGEHRWVLLLAAATLAAAAAGGAAPRDRELEICDGYGYVYSVELSPGVVGGTVQTNYCGEGTVEGTFEPGGGLFCFEVRVTLDTLACCDGYDMDGCWNGVAQEGYYYWNGFGGPLCDNSGYTTATFCDTVPAPPAGLLEVRLPAPGTPSKLD